MITIVSQTIDRFQIHLSRKSMLDLEKSIGVLEVGMRILPRLHLFEWEDQDFCPRFIRDALTNYLNCVWCVGQFYRGTLPIIRKGMQGMTHHRVVDLCSGGGVPSELAGHCPRTFQNTLLF